MIVCYCALLLLTLIAFNHTPRHTLGYTLCNKIILFYSYLIRHECQTNRLLQEGVKPGTNARKPNLLLASKCIFRATNIIKIGQVCSFKSRLNDEYLRFSKNRYIRNFDFGSRSHALVPGFTTICLFVDSSRERVAKDKCGPFSEPLSTAVC